MKPTDPEPQFLTVDEAAELLRVDRKTVYDAVKRGQIPGVRKVGRIIRINRAVLLESLTPGSGSPDDGRSA